MKLNRFCLVAVLSAGLSLAARVDVIYVHIDMDVLDPAEVPGHSLTVGDWTTSRAASPGG